MVVVLVFIEKTYKVFAVRVMVYAKDENAQMREWEHLFTIGKTAEEFFLFDQAYFQHLDFAWENEAKFQRGDFGRVEARWTPRVERLDFDELCVLLDPKLLQIDEKLFAMQQKQNRDIVEDRDTVEDAGARRGVSTASHPSSSSSSTTSSSAIGSSTSSASTSTNNKFSMSTEEEIDELHEFAAKATAERMASVPSFEAVERRESERGQIADPAVLLNFKSVWNAIVFNGVFPAEAVVSKGSAFPVVLDIFRIPVVASEKPQ